MTLAPAPYTWHLVPGQDLLPYHLLLDADDGVLLLDTPRRLLSWYSKPRYALGALWHVVPRNIEPLAMQECLDLGKMHAHLLPMLPPGAALQTLMTIAPTGAMPAWDALRTSVQDDAVVQAQRAAMQRGLPHRELRGTGHLRLVRTLVTVRVPLPGLSPQLLDQVTALLRFPAAQQRCLLRHICQYLEGQLFAFEGYARGVQDTLKAAGHRVTRCAGADLCTVLAQGLSPALSIPPALNIILPLKRQVLTRPLRQVSGGMLFDAEERPELSRLVSLHHAPPRTYPGLLCATRAPEGGEPLALWNTWEGPLTIVVNAAVGDPVMAETKRRLKLDQAKRHAKGSVENTKIAEALEQIQTDIFTSGGQLYPSRVHVVLWGDPQQIPSGLANVQRRGTLFDLAFIPETGAVGSTLWLQTLPLGFDPAFPSNVVLQRDLELTPSQLSHCLTLYGAAQGTTTPSIAYLNDRGEALALHLYDQPTNPHAVITGTSGAGKTFTVGHWVNQMMPLGTSAVVLDPLSNYRSLCEAWDGNFLLLTYEDPPCFNPFAGPRTVAHQAFITAFWSECASGGSTPISWEQRSVLGSAVEHFCAQWDPARGEPTLDHFVEEVLLVAGETFARKDTRTVRLAQQLARQLLLFCGNRQYARFVNGPNTWQLRPGLTVIELSKFSQDPTIQGITCLALAHLATQFFTDPAMLYSWKFIFFDEVWKFLQHPATAKVLQEIIRTYRNFRTSAVFLAQRLEDFDSDIGQIILDLAGTKLFLQREHTEMAKMQATFKLTDAEMELVGKAQKHAGWTSAFLRLGDREGGMVRLVSDRYTEVLMSQDAQIAQRRAQSRTQAVTMREAVALMLAEEEAV